MYAIVLPWAVRVCMQAYVITALQMFSLDAVNASEFLEVYKGVVPPGEFGSMLDELTSGQHSFIHSCLSVVLWCTEGNSQWFCHCLLKRQT